jgi:hypothetical protein
MKLRKLSAELGVASHDTAAGTLRMPGGKRSPLADAPTGLALELAKTCPSVNAPTGLAGVGLTGVERIQRPR